MPRIRCLLAALFLANMACVGAWFTPQGALLPLSPSIASFRWAGHVQRKRAVPGVSKVCAQGFLGWEWGAEKGKSISELLGIISCDASHILIKSTAEDAETLKQLVAMSINYPAGVGLDEAFAQVASEHSQCPSAKKGGSLGWFKPGQMVLMPLPHHPKHAHFHLSQRHARCRRTPTPDGAAPICGSGP